MSHQQWCELSNRAPCMHDFKLGPAPAPLPDDTYVDRWLKLVWMEEYCSMLQFKQEHVSRNTALFNQDAFLTIKVNAFDQEEEAYRCHFLPAAPSGHAAISVSLYMVYLADFWASLPFNVAGKSMWLAGSQFVELTKREALLCQMIWRCLETFHKPYSSFPKVTGGSI